MKVLIAGIARSGTTALYTIMQRILLDQFPQVQFIYEPFLWDKDLFDGLYSDVDYRFNSINSISVEGVYQHQKLPLFINDPTAYLSNPYLLELFRPTDKYVNILAKMIRANGRLVLLNRICPEMTIIFIIRNPLDSVHSILSLFSYYGGEFHHDDFPRFMEGLKVSFGYLSSPEAFQHQVDKELLYWYYMNLYALQAIRQHHLPVLIINFERLIDNPKEILLEVCHHLEIPMKDEYTAWSKKEAGVVTRKFEISRVELNAALPYLEKYTRMLQEFGIENMYDQAKILVKYAISENHHFRTREHYGANPNVIIDQVKKLQERIHELETKFGCIG